MNESNRIPLASDSATGDQLKENFQAIQTIQTVEILMRTFQFASKSILSGYKDIPDDLLDDVLRTSIN